MEHMTLDDVAIKLMGVSEILHSFSTNEYGDIPSGSYLLATVVDDCISSLRALNKPRSDS